MQLKIYNKRICILVCYSWTMLIAIEDAYSNIHVVTVFKVRADYYVQAFAISFSRGRN